MRVDEIGFRDDGQWRYRIILSICGFITLRYEKDNEKLYQHLMAMMKLLTD